MKKKPAFRERVSGLLRIAAAGVRTTFTRQLLDELS
jgi:hypothetical protein